ncbi:ribonuclease P protein subunit p38 [Pelodytes ibericus]
MAGKVTSGSGRKSKKPIVAKTSLKSPYEKTWPTVERDDMQFILKTLLEKFDQVGLKKVEFQNRFKKGAKKNKKRAPEKAAESDAKVESPEVAKKNANKEAMAERPGWTRAEIRKQLAIGINEVTRALEKNELLLVLVCKSVKPDMITKHLIDLSASRDVPACQLPRLSENVASALGLKSVLALGFRKDSDFLTEVKAIIPRVPPLIVPWLKSESKTEPETVDAAPEGDVESQDDESPKPKAGKKRKIKTDTEESPAVKLQGLKVKKIVANPNKIRKVKKTVKKK